MTGLENTGTAPLTPLENEAIQHFKKAIGGGQHWYLALLEAIGLWTQVEEAVGDRTYRYVLNGEAFDWLLLAERLCGTVPGLIPEHELLPLLLHGIPPLELGPDEFKRLIGPGKYHQYLNYFYGVTVETALVLVVQEEVRKERRIAGFLHEIDYGTEVYRRIYGATELILLRKFRKEKGYPQTEAISLTELKEFTYWRFKYRLAHSDATRVASDTKKALEYLRTQLRQTKYKFQVP